jgi:hypothetical protein
MTPSSSIARARFAVEALVSTFPKARVYVLPDDDRTINAVVATRQTNNWTLTVRGHEWHAVIYRNRRGLKGGTKAEFRETLTTEGAVIGFLGMLRFRYLPLEMQHRRPMPFTPSEGNTTELAAVAQLAYQTGWHTTAGSTPSVYKLDIADPDDPLSFVVIVEMLQPGRKHAVIRRQSDGKVLKPLQPLVATLTARAHVKLQAMYPDKGEVIYCVMAPRTFEKLRAKLDAQSVSVSIGTMVPKNDLERFPPHPLPQNMNIIINPLVPEGEIFTVPSLPHCSVLEWAGDAGLG